ncbi:hypothetical protein QFZ82_004323 [Streptomyces sp. V4I23]|uniref:glycine-rich domain-containing protein n=1 Tax=Streptomyces sp. V4I23 TaxID=3042282 RepID=UPI00278A8BC8|nr:hypothetical protein [Streptomyces sp. V4I23]MDQ1009838.1 hypothetical protein [Streptomyces sp. V4I23]
MQRLTARIIAEHPDITLSLARRIVAQAAAFLAASAKRPRQELSPSKLVDIGWHTWILHTVDYALFCQKVVGRFVHHVPTDENEQPRGGAAAARERTVSAIQAAGYTVDAELWRSAADCNQCHAGCHDSPKSG